MASNVLKIVVVLGLMALAVSCEVKVWQECRTDHSWSYCARMLHR